MKVILAADFVLRIVISTAFRSIRWLTSGQTTGLWIWLRRHPRDPVTGQYSIVLHDHAQSWSWILQNIVVCLMDTEGNLEHFIFGEAALLISFSGLDSPHISNSYNWMLSSLALLISSVFLYQTKNSIDRQGPVDFLLCQPALIIWFILFYSSATERVRACFQMLDLAINRS